MKKIFALGLALVCVGAARAQTSALTTPVQDASVADVLKLTETEHDFGKIPQSKPVFYVFEIKNTGNTPLKLDNVQASCGCTTPEWSKEAIPAGATDKIKVGYNAASEGQFEKIITITYNGSQTKVIRIKGNVWRAPEGSAPVNAPVQFLKQQIQ